MVQLVITNTLANGSIDHAHYCGGSIISSRTIVTAAHCYNKTNPITEVVIAEHNLPIKGDGEFYIEVCKVLPHPKYNPGGVGPDGLVWHDYDYALMILCEDLTWSRAVSPICLPDINFNNEGREAIVTGWGSTLYEASPLADILQKSTVKTMTNDQCARTSRFNPNRISQRQICAVNPNTDSCSGDSGGPLSVKDPGYQPYTLVGVVSYGLGNNCTTGGVYTRVAEMLEWTTNNMKGTTCDKENIPEGKLILLLCLFFHTDFLIIAI